MEEIVISSKYSLTHPLASFCLFFLIAFSFHSTAHAMESNYLDKVQKIYIGYYQRPADPAGLIYWAGKLDSNGGNLNQIIEAFANSEESQTLYGTINSGNIATVVNKIYAALFTRDADAGGRDYYVAGFNQSRFTAATIMLNILDGAQNADLQSVNNKLSAAHLFTMTIDPELDGLNLRATYAGLGDVIAGRNFLSVVTSDPATAQTQAGTTTYIQNNIANPNDPIGSLNWLWAKSTGSVGQDELFSVAVDASGNIYITGMYTGSTITFGSFTLTNLGSSDMFLVKYDPNGNVLWAKSAGSLGLYADGSIGSHWDRGMSVTVDTSGNAYVTGTFSGYTITFGSFTLTKSTFYDAVFIVKYDNSGNVIWAKSAGGKDFTDWVRSITTDASGNIYVAGYFSSSAITFGSFTLTNPGAHASHMFLAKYDNAGNVLWAKSTGGSNVALSVAADRSGNIFVAGSSDAFLVKYDNAGNVLWAKSSDYEPAYCVVTDVSGNIFVNTPGSLLKYDTNGNSIWTKSFATTGSYSLAADAGGNIYVAGGSDMFLEKYDNAGNVLWTSGTGGSSGDVSANTVTIDVSGNIYMAGDFYQSTTTLGSFTLTNTSDTQFFHDVFLAKLSSQYPK
jgi:hypothetical protein